MGPVAAIDQDFGRIVAASPGAPLAHVRIFDSFAETEAIWRGLEAAGELATPFQRYDFIAAWQRHVGARIGVKPCPIVVCDDKERAVGLLPLVLRSVGGATVASFPGGKHVTFNMPVWRRDFAASATAECMQTLPQLIAQADPSIDALALTRQPEQWDGLSNPMAMLPRQAAVDECPVLRLSTRPAAKRIGKSFRKRLNQKERRLEAEAPGLRYTVAASAADAKRLLDDFYLTKPQRLAALGLANVFSEPGTEQFLRDAAVKGLTEQRPLIEIHALECDDEVLAIFAGAGDSRHFSMMFNSYTMSSRARYSPGLILIRNIVDRCADLGFNAIDIGTGADEYKLLFCKEREPLFDSFLPITARGQAVALWQSTEARAKRLIKRSPLAMGAFNRLRRTLRL